MSKISKVGVIGAGNMGSGIAQKIAQEGIPVIMMDIKDAFVERGLNNIKSLLQKGVERGVFEPGKVDDILSRIKGTTVIQDVADADIVIEAVFEDKQVKHDLFQRLDATCDAKTILATNTSSFYVREFAETGIALCKASRERRHSGQRCTGLRGEPVFRAFPQRGHADAGRKCGQYPHH